MAAYAARLTVLTEENNFAFYPIQIRLELAEKLGEGSSSRRRLRCQIVVRLENKVNSYLTRSSLVRFQVGLEFDKNFCPILFNQLACYLVFCLP